MDRFLGGFGLGLLIPVIDNMSKIRANWTYAIVPCIAVLILIVAFFVKEEKA